MDKENLLALAKRVMAATEPSRGLDAEIFALTKIGAVPSLIGAHKVWLPRPDGLVMIGERGAHMSALRFTSSLDAAMALVPDECMSWERQFFGYTEAEIFARRPKWNSLAVAKAETKPLALSAAGLLAYAEMANG